MYRESNAVNYQQKVDLSMVKERNLIRHHSTNKKELASNVVTGELPSYSTFKMSLAIAEFVDGWTSFLKFKVTSKSVCHQGHYIQSFFNLINQVTILDRHGVEISREQDVNLLNSLIIRSMFGSDYIETTGHSMLDYNTNPSNFERSAGAYTYTNITDPANPGSTTPSFLNIPTNVIITHNVVEDDKIYEVLIPLSLLSPLFRIDSLLPPQLLNGCIIRIDWENAQKVFTQNLDPELDAIQGEEVFTNGISGEEGYSTFATPQANLKNEAVKIPTYSLSDIDMFIDTYTFNISLSLEIQNEYNEGGIILKLLSYTKVLDDTAEDPRVEYKAVHPIMQSFTKATKIIISSKIEPQAHELELDGILYPTRPLYPLFRGQKNQDLSYYMRFNNQQYPNYSIDSQEPSYFNWLQVFGKNRLYSDVRDLFPKIYFEEQGASFLLDLNRSPLNFQSGSIANATSSNFIISGQRVDGTNPCTLHIDFPAYSDQSILNDHIPKNLKSIFLDAVERRVYGWIEHEKFIFVNQSGNRVAI